MSGPKFARVDYSFKLVPLVDLSEIEEASAAEIERVSKIIARRIERHFEEQLLATPFQPMDGCACRLCAPPPKGCGIRIDNLS